MIKIIYPPFKDCESDFCRCYIQDGVINNQLDENVCQVCKDRNQISIVKKCQKCDDLEKRINHLERLAFGSIGDI